MIPPTAIASVAASAASLLASAADSGAAPTPEPKKNDVVNQADFMRLLIAQLQNQDPLNPLDSANFSSQLAQFSSLEQLTQINQKLDAQGGVGGTSGLDAVSFIGRDVSGTSGLMTVEGGTATGLDYELAAPGAVTAQILDGNGRQLATLPLGPQSAGTHHFELATVPNAPTLPDGTYTLRLTVPDATGTAVAVPTTVTGHVTGVDLGNEPPTLLLGDIRLAITDVNEIRETPPETGGPS